MDADVAYEVPYAYTVAASARAGGRKFATADAAARDGVLQLDATAKELCHERVTVDTRDHEDHTFCGVMFPVECRTELPCEYIELQSVSVRGDLGPMTVWYTRRSFDDVNETEEAWTRVYSGEHVPTEMSTSNTYTELRLAEAIRLAPGERVGMYVHSAMPGDNGLVYDNQRQQVTHADKVFRILPGYAHLSNRPFGTSGPWGRPWRTNREFVGRIEFGVRWKMWSPSAEVHHAFPAGFRATVVTMLLASRRPESLLYLLQDEILFFILNKCAWDSWGEAMHEAEESRGGGGGGGRSSSRSGGRWWDDVSVMTPRDGSSSWREYFGSSYGPGSHRSQDSLRGSTASNLAARRLARSQNRFEQSLQLGAAAFAAAQATAAADSADDDDDDDDGQGAVPPPWPAAATAAAAAPGGESQRLSLLDARIRELLASVGDGRVAHGGDSDEDDSDGGGSLPPEEPEYEAGSDAWVAEQVRLSLALHPANFGAEDDEEADP